MAGERRPARDTLPPGMTLHWRQVERHRVVRATRVPVSAPQADDEAGFGRLAERSTCHCLVVAR
jgi:hypothetical protein